MAKSKELPVNSVICGDSFEVLPSFPKESVDMIMFSPPYWGLRDYGLKTLPGLFAKGGIGLEDHPQQYIERMVVLCKLLRRVLKKQGSMYLNLGDTYFGRKNQDKGKNVMNPKFGEGKAKLPTSIDYSALKTNWLQPKQKLLMPSRVAIALQHDGWILRNDIIWHKPNHMPSSVKDRLTSSYEHIFHFVKARKYWYDLDAIRRPHKRGTATAERDFKRMMSGRHEYEGKTETLLGRKAFVVGHSLGKNPADVLEYESKYEKGRHGQSPQGFIRNQTIAKDRVQSRIDAKRLFPSNPKKQQEYINFIHDHNTSNPLGKNPGDFWSITTKPFPQAHFAVYPEAICMMPIKSSCPREICKACGKPRTRKTKTSYVKADNRSDEAAFQSRRERGRRDIPDNQFITMRFAHVRALHKTVGWSDCGCGKGFEPGVVLDPMCGAGTTLLAAHNLGRKWIGIDLNPSYVEMSKKRLQKECSRWLSDFTE